MVKLCSFGNVVSYECAVFVSRRLFSGNNRRGGALGMCFDDSLQTGDGGTFKTKQRKRDFQLILILR